MKPRISLLTLIVLLVACQPSRPPISADLETEFTLAPVESATVTDTGLTIRLTAVPGDERCPSGVECFASGPVTLQISVQAGSAAPVEFVMQTFTDSDGRAPGIIFEGIQDRVEFGNHLIRVVAVLPYPQGFGGKIQESKYRITFIVTDK